MAAPRPRRPGPLTTSKELRGAHIWGTKREASKALAAMVTESGSAACWLGGKERLRPYPAWLSTPTPSFSPKTVEISRMYLEAPIIPAIGSVPVIKLTAADLDRFYRQLLEVGRCRGPYSPATIRRVHGIIRRALTQGVRWGWIRPQPGDRCLASSSSDEGNEATRIPEQVVSCSDWRRSPIPIRLLHLAGGLFGRPAR